MSLKRNILFKLFTISDQGVALDYRQLEVDFFRNFNYNEDELRRTLYDTTEKYYTEGKLTEDEYRAITSTTKTGNEQEMVEGSRRTGSGTQTKKPQLTSEPKEKGINRGKLEEFIEKKEFFKARYGKPIEKAIKKELEEVFSGIAIPYTPETKILLDKISNPAKGIQLDEYRTNLLYGGFNKHVFTDGFILIIDKNIADTINTSNIETAKKKEIKSLQKASAELSHTEAQRMVDARTEELIKDAEKQYPKYEQVIPKVWNKEKAKILGFQLDDRGNQLVYLSDGKINAVINSNLLAFLQKHLPNAAIHLTGELTSIVFEKNGTLQAIAMPIRIENNPFAKKAKEEKQEKAPSGYASIGEYADIPNVTLADENITSIAFPEIVQFTKDIMGKYPVIRKMDMKLGGIVAGRFFPVEGGKIYLNPDIFDTKRFTIEQIAKTLAHEVGHLFDYLPDKDMRRGNILGRIGSLNHYMKTLLAEFPEGEILTDKDRVRIRKEAERMAKTNWVEETRQKVVGHEPVKPEEIKAIWNDITAAYRELHSLTLL